MRIEGTSKAYTRAGAFDDVMLLQDKKRAPFHKQFSREKACKNSSYKVGTQGGLPQAPVVPFGDRMSVVDFQTPYDMEVNPLRRAFAMVVEEHTSDTDFYNLLGQRGPLMADGMRQAEDWDLHDLVLNRATSSTNLTPDGLSVANAAHLYEGGTFSNIVSTNAPLSYAALAEIERMFMEVPWHNGDPTNYVGLKRLMVPPALRDLAMRLTGADKFPGTSDNDPNFAGRSFSVYASAYFNVSATAYCAIAAEADKNPVVQIIRSPQRTDEDKDVLAEAKVYTLSKNWGSFIEDPRFYIYSAGV